MTSNEISAAATREQARHDQVVEEETHRYNDAWFGLEREKLELQQRMHSEEMAHKKEQLYYQKQIDALNLQVAQGKLEADKSYHDSIVSIQQFQAMEEAQYKMAMTEMGYMKADLDAKAQAELERHNKVLEGNEEIKRYLEGQQLEFQKHQFNENNYLAWANYGLTKQQMEAEKTYKLNTVAQNWIDLGIRQYDAQTRRYGALFNYEVGMTTANAAALQAQTAQEKSQSEKFRNYANGAYQIVGSLDTIFKDVMSFAGGGLPTFKLNGGNSNGPSPQQQFENLFK